MVEANLRFDASVLQASIGRHQIIKIFVFKRGVMKSRMGYLLRMFGGRPGTVQECDPVVGSIV